MSFKLQDLQEELATDVAINRTQLEQECYNNPIIYSKWLTKYSSIKKEIISVENQKKAVLKNRLDFYTGRLDNEICMDRYERSEMKTVMSADEAVLALDTKIQYLSLLMEFCSSAIDCIKSRGFTLKNIIDLRKFEAGT